MKYLVSVFGIVTSLSMFMTITHASEGDVSIKDRIIFEGSTLNGASLNDDNRYGTSVANIGDLNGDNIDDFAIGAVLGDNKNGEIHIHLMKQDGSIKETKEINSKTDNSGLTHGDYNRYGSAIVGLGDIDGDGVNDIAVGAEGEFDTKEKTRGAVYIHFMKQDGSIKETKKIVSTEKNSYNKDMFGSALASADYDSDGNIDLAVGAKGNDYGYIYIFFLKPGGDIKEKVVRISNSTKNGASGLAKNAMYGSSIANLGDIDGDGVNDIAAGAPNAIGDKENDECDKGQYCQQGAVYVHLMNNDASIKKTISFYAKDLQIDSLELGDRYGVSVAGGDFNKDGVMDIAVGASGRWADEGVVYLHILNEEHEIVETETIDDHTSNGARENDGDDFYGASIANVGDFNNDGIEDLLIGSYGFEGGMAYLHFLNKSLVESQNIKRETNASEGICDVSSIEYSPIYRLYNTDTGFHLYTRGEEDRDKILNRWNDFQFDDAGPAFYASLEKTCENTTPIFRLYNNETGAHLYTRGVGDKDKILKKYPAFEFTDNGPAFYASLTDDGATPIYRLYNTKTGVHLYTRGEADRDKIMKKWSEFEFTDGQPAFYARLDI